MKNKEIKTNLKILLLLFLFLLFVFFLSLYFSGKKILTENDEIKFKSYDYQEVSLPDFQKMLKFKDAKDLFLIYTYFDLPKTDIIFDGVDFEVKYNEIVKNKDKLPNDKKRIILVYSDDPKIAMIAAQKIALLGYKVFYLSN